VARALESAWRADAVTLAPLTNGNVEVRCLFRASSPLYKTLAEVMNVQPMAAAAADESADDDVMLKVDGQ